MRVIGGSLRGRRLSAPRWAGLRPTSGRLRETLFDILGNGVRGARVVDGFAGTGAIGIEALSRGAGHVTFIESDARAARLITENLRRCGVERGYTILRGPMARAWRRSQSPDSVDLVFLDPPYDANGIESLVRAAAPHVAPDGVIVVEHPRGRPCPDRIAGMRRARTVTAGDSALSFYRDDSAGASTHQEP